MLFLALNQTDSQAHDLSIFNKWSESIETYLSNRVPNKVQPSKEKDEENKL